MEKRTIKKNKIILLLNEEGLIIKNSINFEGENMYTSILYI